MLEKKNAKPDTTPIADTQPIINSSKIAFTCPFSLLNCIRARVLLKMVEPCHMSPAVTYLYTAYRRQFAWKPPEPAAAT